MKIHVSGDIRAAEIQLSAFQAEIPQIVARVLNRTAVTVRADAAREIAARSGLRVSDVRRRLPIDRATRRKPLVRILASGGITLPLMLFKPRQTATGVTVRVDGGVVSIPHAFIKPERGRPAGVYLRTKPGAAARSRSGGVLYTAAGDAYRRYRKDGIRVPNGMDAPISQLRAPGIPAHFLKVAISAAFERRAHERFNRTLQQEINYWRLKKSGGV